MKLAGVVVLYNTDIETYHNILKYYDALDKLYIFDNSDRVNIDLLKMLNSLKKVFVIDNYGNKGIAFALNATAKLAKQDGFEWLLTMDQDSFYDLNMLEILKKRIENSQDKKIAIFAPIEKAVFDKYINKPNILYSNETITSGSIINLNIHTEVNGFKNDLFIYVVDYEYCWKIRKFGYSIIQYTDIVLNHQVNDYKNITSKYDKIKRVYCRNTSELAYYYVIRNNLYLIREYKDIFPNEVKSRFKFMIVNWTKMALKEKHTMRKIRYMLKGYYDYRKNIVGKYKDKK